ncbi:hypothetical protein M0R45_012325 [Rubus argutus]|uniref:Uncharacterized protein n=1 Tax=Rubus argutus TaxID=59490 RepID=A0AAW1YCV7_RUBAR
MILPIIVGFLPIFVGMYLLYSCLLRCAASSEKRETHGGLSSAELQKLPKMSGKEATRLQPCLPSPVRRHLACQAIYTNRSVVSTVLMICRYLPLLVM